MDPVLISVFVSFFLSCYVCMTGSHPEKNNSNNSSPGPMENWASAGCLDGKIKLICAPVQQS